MRLIDLQVVQPGNHYCEGKGFVPNHPRPATIKDLIEALANEGYAVIDMTAWANFAQ